MNKLLASIALSCFSMGMAEPAPHSTEVVDFIKQHFELQGTLKHSDNFVYVKVNDQFIIELAPLLSGLSFIPPDYCEGGKVGAHITVIYPDEMKLFGIEAIDEIDETISFHIETCQIVYPKRNFESAYLILVDSPRLDEIREKYGLGKKEYPFHITIGVKPVSMSN